MALTTKRITREKTIKTLAPLLSAGEEAFEGGLACIDTSTGECVPGQASTTLVPIGTFAESIDNSAGVSGTPVRVRLDRERVARWWNNAGGADAVLASDILQDCYILDDDTVTITATAHSKAGKVLAVDTNKGVLVEFP